MTGTRPAEILRHLEAGPTDRDLLARFVRARDHSAFAELVRRHGPVVLGVCRRVTGHPQDAEDAFQAVFLVLARKAASVGNPDLLGNWLYGVAVRVARKARRSAARRRAREVAVSPMPDPPDNRGPTPPGSPELGPILDEELAALPAWYREAIVLCDLRGVSREEAAAALGIPEGTLSSRLANGRKKLAARLSKRGVALSAAALPAVVAEAQAVVPAELVTKTCGLVADWSAGGAVPGPLARLAEGGFAVRKTLVLGVAVSVVALAGAVFAAGRGDNPPAADPPKQPTAARPAAAPEQKQKPDPDAKPADKQRASTTSPRMQKARDYQLNNLISIAWAPDGSAVAIDGVSTAVGNSPRVVKVDGTLFDPKMGVNADVYTGGPSNRLVGFTPDSKTLITAQREYDLVSGFHQLHYTNLEQAAKGHAAGGNPRTVDLDADDTFGYAFAPDGKTFRTVAVDLDKATHRYRKLTVQSVDAATGKTLKTLMTAEGEFLTYAFSGNGKRLGVLSFSKDAQVYPVTAYDVDTGKKLWTKPPKFERGPSGSFEMEFSPDGSRLVVTSEINRPLVFNGETGDELPRLEHAEHLSPSLQGGSFSGDGRLLAMSGARSIATDLEGRGGGSRRTYSSAGLFLYVWDTETGKLLKAWDRGATVSFHPTKPILAILESNGENSTRLGLWDFSADTGGKK